MTSSTVSSGRPNRLAVSSARMVLLLLRARAGVVLVLLIVLFSALAPSFLTANNLAILSKHVAISAILAIGMTFVVLTGGIDLSVGSVAGLAGMVAGYVLTQGVSFGGSLRYPPVFIAIVAALAIGLVVGLVAGWWRRLAWRRLSLRWARFILRAARHCCCRMEERFPTSPATRLAAIPDFLHWGKASSLEF